MNIEVINKSKCQYLLQILLVNKTDLALVQKAHLDNENQVCRRPKIVGYDVIGITYDHIYGIVLYARSNIENVKLILTNVHSDIHTIIVKVGPSTSLGITVLDFIKQREMRENEKISGGEKQNPQYGLKVHL
ncbi:UNVERIFIED_CONTAM: hypothetical protein K2H54_036061 [Gekko kuhli]